MARKGYDDGWNAARKENLYGFEAKNPYPPDSGASDNWMEGYGDYNEHHADNDRRELQESECLMEFTDE